MDSFINLDDSSFSQGSTFSNNASCNLLRLSIKEGVILRQQLPSIYQNLLNSKILIQTPKESLATCDNCLMSRPERGGSLPYYSPHLKCCTYHPFMPNFLVGSILMDSDTPEFVINKIKEKILQSEFALPIGIAAPLVFQIDFYNRKSGEFGNREDWICPYFDLKNKNCGIWKHRGSVCSTFYCKSSKKKKGEQYWFQLSEYLSLSEMFLAEECLAEFGYTPREVSEQFEYLNRNPVHGKVWKVDNIMNFYVDCYKFVLKMTRRKFINGLGEVGKTLEKSCIQSYKEAQYEPVKELLTSESRKK